MKTFLMTIVLTVPLLFMSIMDVPNSSLRQGFVTDAEAIIGMPWTPHSFAGAARRSMYAEAAYGAAAAQAAAANAAAAQAAAAQASAAAAAAQAAAAALPVGTIVPNLPPGCTSTVIAGVNYFNCNGIYYRAGFQGNNIVYIVSQP
jgi:hypothetical protein